MFTSLAQTKMKWINQSKQLLVQKRDGRQDEESEPEKWEGLIIQERIKDEGNEKT